jgi:hypothetical protein
LNTVRAVRSLVCRGRSDSGLSRMRVCQCG